MKEGGTIFVVTCEFRNERLQMWTNIPKMHGIDGYLRQLCQVKVGVTQSLFHRIVECLSQQHTGTFTCEVVSFRTADVQVLVESEINSTLLPLPW